MTLTSIGRMNLSLQNPSSTLRISIPFSFREKVLKALWEATTAEARGYMFDEEIGFPKPISGYQVSGHVRCTDDGQIVLVLEAKQGNSDTVEYSTTIVVYDKTTSRQFTPDNLLSKNVNPNVQIKLNRDHGNTVPVTMLRKHEPYHSQGQARI